MFLSFLRPTTYYATLRPLVCHLCQVFFPLYIVPAPDLPSLTSDLRSLTSDLRSLTSDLRTPTSGQGCQWHSLALLKNARIPREILQGCQECQECQAFSKF